jgi:peptidyl-dipeptidase Dcp
MNLAMVARCANTTYPVYLELHMGFVELPSNGKLVLRTRALALFATHYQTGEIIPMELVQKIKESSNFQEGWQPCVS